ncbi:MAG: nuclear transport factor 2 family protein [Bacteroidota bacterium]
MKNVYFFLGFWACQLILAQPNTEVYLFDLDMAEDKIGLFNPKNISNNEGYDNQPSFMDNNTLLYAATRDGQTDILKFDIVKGSVKTWITDTPTGSEYSPLKMPEKSSISAIRLDLDGLQRLYAYDMNSGNPTVLLENLKVGYQVWYNKNILVCTVLVENGMNLVVANLQNGQVRTVDKNVGRSLQRVPYKTQISYIKKVGGQWEIKALDPLTLEIGPIMDTVPDTQDICWLQDGTLLAGNGKMIFYANPDEGIGWKPLMHFEDEEIQNISRIAVNESNTRLAFVAEVSPRHIVEEQLKAYNSRDIEGFTATFSEDVELFNFPNEPIGKGKENLIKTYRAFFESTPDLHCEIKNRIVIGNKVIDEEYLTVNGQNFAAVAIYEVKNGKIAKVTFIQ